MIWFAAVVGAAELSLAFEGRRQSNGDENKIDEGRLESQQSNCKATYSIRGLHIYPAYLPSMVQYLKISRVRVLEFCIASTLEPPDFIKLYIKNMVVN